MSELRQISMTVMTVDFQGGPLRDSKYIQNNYAPRFAHFGQKSAFGTWTNKFW